MDKLRKCQQEALNAFEKYYYIDEEDDRGIISMCCGSGKTRTTYEIIKLCIEKYNKKFFILATSRKELIYQVASEYNNWIKINKLDVTIKIVGGSGEQYTKSTLYNEEDIKNTIKAIVCNDKKPLIIITTYNSSKKIIDAIDGQKELLPELVILDEAHNTTGENSKENQELIKKDNEKFSSEKYLFMTATPVKLIMKNEDAPFQNKETIFSMNNSNIYGKIVYEYSFSDGIHDGIIVDFEIIYYTKNDELPQELLEELKNKTKKEKQNIFFRTISNFLINCIKEKKLKYILVYCANQKKMNIMKEWIEKENFDCNVFTIISEDTKTKRTKTRQEFKKYINKPNILLSVGIFDEGVDEKCIDAVLFAEERNTESRIVQNIGRCLRTHPNKKIGYVIIPNIVYEFDEQDKGNDLQLSNNYSSHYKQIRYVASKIKQNIKNNFFKKLVKGDVPYVSDDDENDKIDLCDEFIEADEIIKLKKVDDDTINDKDINDLSKYYKQESTRGDISNETLEKLKKFVILHKIDSIKKWSKFTSQHELPYFYLHSDFKTEWISWGQFLYGQTNSYDESKKLFENELKGKFKTSTEWVEYYNKVLENELKDQRDGNIAEELINKIIRIPNRPQEYYKGEWKDWNDFLNLEEKINHIGLLVSDESNDKTKADKNMNILVNTDHDKVKGFKNGEYNNIILPDDLLNELKKYIDEFLGVDTVLQVRVATKNNGNYDKCCINCRLKNDVNKAVPIVIYPEEKKFKYDYDALKWDNYKNKEINRNREQYVQNPKINKLFDKIINDIKEMVKKAKIDAKDECKMIKFNDDIRIDEEIHSHKEKSERFFDNNKFKKTTEILSHTELKNTVENALEALEKDNKTSSEKNNKIYKIKQQQKSKSILNDEFYLE